MAAAKATEKAAEEETKIAFEAISTFLTKKEMNEDRVKTGLKNITDLVTRQTDKQ